MKIDEGLISLIYKTIRTGLKISANGPYVEFELLFINGNNISFKLKKEVVKYIKDALNSVDV